MNIVRALPQDAIPSVEDPDFTTDYGGDPTDDVVAVEPDGGPARAYPVRVLHYHEIVNDAVPGGVRGACDPPTDGTCDVPIAVTWCPLCGSGVVYDRRVDGRTLSFGVSGKLADDDLVMYDRETDSEWKQSSGACIAGPQAGASLDVLPGSMLTAGAFADAYPDGLVLDPPGGTIPFAPDGPDSPDEGPVEIQYDADPYADYVDGDGFGLAAMRGEGEREWTRTDLAAKDVVLGLELDGAALAFPRSAVTAAGDVVETTVGETAVVVFAGPSGLYAYRDPGVSFSAADDLETFDGDGTTWAAASGHSDDGRALERLPCKRQFAFAWQDDHGPDRFWLA